MNGEEGSTASTATLRPLSRTSRTTALVVVDLPTPEPVNPMTWA